MSTHFKCFSFGSYTTVDGKVLEVYLARDVISDAYVKVTLPNGTTYLRTCSKDRLTEAIEDERKNHDNTSI